MAFDISQFRSTLQYDGARPALFQCTITNPINNSAYLNVPFMIKAAGLPAYQLGIIPVMYFGRAVKLAGDRTFEPWNVQVINDETFDIRENFETWNAAINTLKTNFRATGGSQSSLYTSSAQVNQFDKEGNIIRTYTFQNMWPVMVGPIELSWDAANQIETFGVQFAYDWFEPSGTTVSTSSSYI